VSFLFEYAESILIIVTV